jgi:hypothetical protein
VTAVALLDERAGTQRGKPRSRDPGGNPLGCRVYDLSCTWPMYRQRYGLSFRYTCGLYQQSQGRECAHNHVDGPQAVRFLLGCLRQRVLAPALLQKLEKRLLEIARREQEGAPADLERRASLARLDELQAKLERVGRNLALAETEEQFRAVSAVQKELQQRHDELAARLAVLEGSRPGRTDVQTEVEEAIGLLGRLTDLMADGGNYDAVGELFRQVNVRLFLRFQEAQLNKRTINKLASGVVTFGSAPPPVALYDGPTGRGKRKGPAAGVAAGPGDLTVPA